MRIGSIMVINLDRRPGRWRRLLQELGRFKTAEGAPLTAIVQRLPAVDARDGRAVAATADVDPIYKMGDQLFVQPDPRLEQCFGTEQPIRMTRQEVAVARSHVEAWKAIAAGPDRHVLILEDDVWFRSGSAKAIERGWRAALQRGLQDAGPHLLYLSFKEAGGMAVKADECDALFRPVGGLWFLSGYVLSREGAVSLLKAMPVVGPVDLWMNYRFEELGALALARPAILQREDGASDNAYSVLPFLARAGVVDAGAPPARPEFAPDGLTAAWTAGGKCESLAMALSMLGLRVKVFDGFERELSSVELARTAEIFDAVVNAPLSEDALRAAIGRSNAKFILEAGATEPPAPAAGRLPRSRTLVLADTNASWIPVCRLLALVEPVEAFPMGAPCTSRLFRDDRAHLGSTSSDQPGTKVENMDDSPWVLPARAGWLPRAVPSQYSPPLSDVCSADIQTPPPDFVTLVETFPGNLATFDKEGIVQEDDATRLILSDVDSGIRPYRSGAFASACAFGYGHFEAEIKAAAGAGLVTGFFLHRDSPRQEIDIELMGDDPRQMLVNVYFNPGDDGSAMGFGYRGTPCRIDLGFDASADFHKYAIDWSPGRIVWSIDGLTVQERHSWDPTPIPHLPMRLHANLWAPRSEELAGQIDRNALPASAIFRKVSISVSGEG
jgi:GR25 family glycosyltransferase involved in LPS biosynthesis